MREQAKELYLQGYGITQISNTLNLTRQTIYKYKAKDSEDGISWDEQRLVGLRNPQDIKTKEAIFLNTLISSFDKFIKKAQEEEDALSADVLDKLHSYAKTYWSLKAPAKLDAKELTLEVATATIQRIAQLALDKKDTPVINFLSQNSDLIVKEVLKNANR